MSAATAAVPGLGRLESAIMTAIWDAGRPLSVRVVRERLNYQAANGEDPAYTTVMTVMTVLADALSAARSGAAGRPMRG